MSDTGFEPSPESQGKTQSETARAKYVATERTETPKFDPDLQAIIDAWQTLSESVKADILAMVASY
ncbi:MAG: hypothetical protein IH991_09100 [Planctomycetes bacterium]|nr:hypothetical protein [Planctomycetota bacterium]